MIDNKLLNKLKIGVAIIAALLISIFTYNLGNELGKKSVEKQFEETHNIKLEDKVEKTEINPAEVKEFLINYFTKKDLGENRERYKPYMSDALFNSQITEEDKAANAAYKGFIVDYEFEDSRIYINNDNKEVIVAVKYKNKHLASKDNRETAISKNYNETYRLTYVKARDGFVVNNIEKINVLEA